MNRIISEVCTQYYIKLTNHAYCRIKDMDASKKIINDAFVASLKEQDAFFTEDDVVKFLYKAVDQGCEALLKDRQQIEQIRKTIFDKKYENYQINNIVLLAIEEEVEKLPRRFKQILRLFFCGLTADEIAEVIKRKVKTVKNNKYIARVMLINALRERGLLSV